MGDKLYTQTFIICPWCDMQSGCRVDHLFAIIPSTFGHWSCNECGKSFSGTVSSPGKVILKRENKPPYGRAMALLRFDGKGGPVFFVMDRKYHTAGEPDAELQSSDNFFFEEYSCPTNWLSDCVAVIEQGDADPHGFLMHVRSVEVPRDFDPDEQDWRTLFPEAFPTEAIG